MISLSRLPWHFFRSLEVEIDNRLREDPPRSPQTILEKEPEFVYFLAKIVNPDNRKAR